MTPEGKVKKLVKSLLDPLENTTYYYMPVQNGMGRTVLDFIGCNAGRFFAIETKAPGKDLRPLQQVVARDMRRAGAQVFEIDGPDAPDFQRLKEWLI